MQETLVRFLGQEDPLEKPMATHSGILAWRISIDRRAWRTTVHEVTESDTTERLKYKTLAEKIGCTLTTEDLTANSQLLQEIDILGD